MVDFNREVGFRYEMTNCLFQAVYDQVRLFLFYPSGKANGGDLGVIKRNQMDKDFMIYLDGLQPGETSGISCTAFGFHIIRRNQDVTINQSP